MKKVLPLLLILSLLLSGCSSPTDSTEAPTREPTINSMEETQVIIEKDEDEVPSAPVYSQQPMAAVSMPVIEDIITADNGTVIAKSKHQNIHLFVQDQQIADTVIIDFLNRQDAHISAAEDLKEQAKRTFSDNQNWTPYIYELIYTPKRIDTSVLSLFGQNVIYSGGNHPQLESMAANYNMITGEVLTLGSILTDVDAADTLCDLVVQQMSPMVEQYNLFDEYPEIVRHRFSREESYDEDWFFTPTGLNFYFAPYEVAPYTSGTVVVEIPYSQLAGVITDAFFPAESDLSEGVVAVERLEEADMQVFSQIAEVYLDPNGEKLFIHCDGLVRNVCLQTGIWDNTTDLFSPSATVFLSNTLSPGDGITVQIELDKESPTLCLSYQSADQIVTSYLSVNTADGALCLTEIP